MRALLSRSRAPRSLSVSLSPLQPPGGSAPAVHSTLSLSLFLSLSLCLSGSKGISATPTTTPPPFKASSLLHRSLANSKKWMMCDPRSSAVWRVCTHGETDRDVTGCHFSVVLRVLEAATFFKNHESNSGGSASPKARSGRRGVAGVSSTARCSLASPDTVTTVPPSSRARSPVSTPPAQSSTRAPTRSPPPLSPPSAPLWSLASMLPAAAAVSSGRCWVRAGGVVVVCALL